MSTHNLCFEQKYENYQRFLSESFQVLEVKFSLYLNRRVFVMFCRTIPLWNKLTSYVVYGYNFKGGNFCIFLTSENGFTV